MAYLAIGAALLVLLLWLAGRFARAEVRTIRRVGTGVGVGLLGVGAAVLLWRGGLGSLPLIAGLGAFGWRAWRMRRASRGFRRTATEPDGESQVETASLRMRLDHATGRMSGEVRRGRHAGRDLAELDLPALLTLLEEVRATDTDSVPLLEAWLDRAAPDWRASGRATETAAPSGAMTRAEAYAVLGLESGAGEDAIRAAHRRLMRTAHPDSGGSTWLASRINQARDLLLSG